MVDVRFRKPVRVLVLGMRCAFTLPVVAALIGDSGVEVVGAVVPGDRSPVSGQGEPAPSPPFVAIGKAATSGRPSIALSAASQSPLDVQLRRNSIPLIEAPSLRKRDLAPLLARLDVPPLDAIVVACFPWRVPRWLRELPRFGALNVHPSLLPALRGPEPEFWALRLGLWETGVTVHLMDEGLDTGPVLAQRPLPIPPEVTLPALERSLATAGGALVTETLSALARSEAVPRPQTGEVSCAPTPKEYDLSIPTDLPAGWAARFVRALAPVYAPLTVLVMATGQRLNVDGVAGVDEGGALPAPVVEEGDGIAAVRFTPGVVRFHRAAGSAMDRRGRS